MERDFPPDDVADGLTRIEFAARGPFDPTGPLLGPLRRVLWRGVIFPERCCGAAGAEVPKIVRPNSSRRSISDGGFLEGGACLEDLDDS